MNKIKAAITTPETKPFYLTSEFWLLIASGINTVASGAQNKEALVLNGLAGLYALARGLAKSGSPAEPAVAPAEGTPTDMPMAGSTDIQPALPSMAGSGTKGVEPAEAATPAVAQDVNDLGNLLAKVREVASEHPEIITQLKTEGVL